MPAVYGQVNAIAFEVNQPATISNGKYDQILLGGDFTQVGSFTSKNMISLKPNGDVAWTLESPDAPNGAVRVIRTQLDGSILVGGAFREFSGYAVSGLARLNGPKAESGTYVYFDKPEFRTYEKLKSLDLSVTRSGIGTNASLSLGLNIRPENGAVLSDLGNIPSTINFSAGETQKIISIPIVNDSLTSGAKRFRASLVLTETNVVLMTRSNTSLTILDDDVSGTRDPNFGFSFPAHPTAPFLPESVPALASQPDGKILFAYYDQGPKMARLNADGTFDPTFQMEDLHILNTNDATITQIEVASDGKIYVGGTFVTVRNAFGNNLLVRLNSDGSLDNSFSSRIRPTFSRTISNLRFALQSDGKILVGSEDSIQHDGPYSYGVPIRLNSDGSFDSTFASISSPREGSVLSLREDGVLFLATKAISETANGDGPASLWRYSSGGIRDTNFIPNLLGPIYSLQAFRDFLLVGGRLQTTNGIRVEGIAKLNPVDGSRDTNFLFQSDGYVRVLLPLESGKLLVGGDFTRVNGVDRYRLARINSDGTLDLSFDPGFGLNVEPSAVLEQTDHELLVGGAFTRADLVPVPGLIRLEEPASPGFDSRLLLKRNGTQILFQYDGRGRLEATDDFLIWTTVKPADLNNPNGEYAVPETEPYTMRFYRVLFEQ
jgi:uncharacterized delta-60 repeat protein